MSDATLTPVAELFGKQPKRRFLTLPPLPVNRAVLRIRSLFENERQAWESASVDKNFKRIAARIADTQRRLFQLVLVDENGNTYVTDANRQEMADWDSADAAALYEAVSKHCGLSQAGLEALSKNSEGTDGDESP